MPRASWNEKLSKSHGLPRVVAIPEKMVRRWGQGTMVIPAPREVAAIMKAVPRGKLITLREICAILAAKHRANCGCPLTTGIFSWIAAHAGEELAAAGHEEVTPYWRTLKTGGMLNDKYPGGIPNLTARLEAEGHRVRQKGRNTVVADYEASLWRVFAAGEDEDA